MKTIWILLWLSSVGWAYDWSTNPGDGSPENPYQLSMPIQLTTIGSANLLDKCFILTTDINLYGLTFPAAVIAPDTSDLSGFQGTPFSGTLDGNGYAIWNLEIVNEWNAYLGLFGCLSAAAKVRNLHLENVFIHSSGFTSNIGSLAAVNDGTISNCSATGEVLIESVFGGDESGGGGLVGGNTGTIRRCSCWNDVIVPEVLDIFLDRIGGLVGINGGLIEDCSAAGTVQGAWYAGGLVGENAGDIRSSCASGSATALGGWYAGGLVGEMGTGTITGCYASGESQAGEASGGLIGRAGNIPGETTAISSCYALTGGMIGYVEEWPPGSISVTSCYFLGTPGPSYWWLGTPLDDPNMMIRGNFAGWDFVDDGSDGPNNIWRMCADGVDYPRLSWEVGQGGDYACPDGVGMDDLEALALAWLTEGSDPDYNYAADGSGDGQINTDDFDILSKNWLQGLPPTIRSSHVGGCGGFPEMAESLILPAAENPPRFTVTVQGAFILFEDPIVANCCIGGIELALSIEGNQILLEEREIPKALCFCICTYPTTATLGPFAPGEYMFEVVQISEGGTGFIGQVPVVIE